MKIIKSFLTVAILTTLLATSCTGVSKQENAASSTTETVGEEIVTTTSTDQNGQKLEMTFNNTKGTATITFNGETAELEQQKSGSGFWYKNNQYELRGKGNDVDLKKDGELVFTHKDEIVTSTIKNKEGQTLDMTFNNTTNEAKVYLDGGEQIDLKGQTPGSGIWYKNDHYELRGKGENVELTKDGKVIFKNE